MYLIHEFHILSWITEINELFHDILIYWDAPVYIYKKLHYGYYLYNYIFLFSYLIIVVFCYFNSFRKL